MGRRSRKRAIQTPSTRAERDAARSGAAGSSERRQRARRPGIDERPPPPWGSFPLSELLILAGILLIAWGLFSGQSGEKRLAAGLIVASLGGGELAVREHVTGFRSHTTLLASAAAFAVVTAVALLLGPVQLWLLLVLALVVFGAGFAGLRELFKRRSGGVSFR
ncbi:MAG: hypothetical protein ABR581_00860 [Thermoleophilaceae bacterium]